ncbi:Holliday junction resolvase RuvX [Candidatus Peregrinibacteria bacterium]|nr:Holliday junction resolvase RuvX [Candidatus Peregrinibacteria bacterium]
MGKLLALDIGTKRVGYAVADEANGFAFPRTVIAKTPTAKFVEDLKKIVREEGICKIIIGLPLDAENEEGGNAKRIRKFGENLACNLMLPIEYVDEFGSTDEALAKIPFRGDRGRNKDFRDAISAQIILQRYLDNKKI